MMSKEMARRLEAVRKGMRQAKLDGYLILDRANTRYIADFPCTSSYILITLRDGWFVTDFRYIEAARRGVCHLEVFLQDKPKEDLARLVKKAKIRRLGVERNLPYGLALEYAEAFAPAKLAADDKPIGAARARKSRAEIAILREAIQRTDAAYCDLLEALQKRGDWLGAATKAPLLANRRPSAVPVPNSSDLTETLVRNCLRRMIEKHGGDKESFDSIIACGANASRPHAVPGGATLAHGEIVQVDTGMLFQGYCSDLSRVFAVGRVTPKMRRIHQIVLDAQRRALDFIRVGVKAKAADAKARDYIAKKGYGKAFGHGLGHGLGLDIHEPPTLNSRSEDVLEEGMIVTVEPGIYLPGWGGVRIEDVVVVKRGGCEILSAAPREIAIV